MHAVLRDYFANRDVTGEAIDDFLLQLKDEHDAYVAGYLNGVHISHTGQYFSVVITSLQDGRIIDYLLRCPLKADEGLAPAKYATICKTGGLLVQGEQDVKDALYSLRHPALEDLYAQADVLALISEPDKCPFGIVTVDRAVEICRLVNRVASERMEAITGQPSTISPDCDVYVVNKDGVYEA